MSNKAQSQNVLSNFGTLLPDLESVYKDIHSHPELSMQEKRAAGIASDRLRSAGYEIEAMVVAAQAWLSAGVS
jgi:metal-dependent amidase/aminoacylase/carboxypeptidase family protein